MFTGIATFFAGLFSSSKMQDTAIDAVRKLGGLDEMTHKEKAQFLLDYMSQTKHQSPVRRFIALALTIAYTAVILTWVISAGVGYNFNYVPSIEYAGAIKMFMESVIVQPFNIILAFYFVTNIAQKLGK
jgi:hypothetical protein